ncbi:MAG: response regulator [Caldilineaceae bacterium]|nr:response regulator [Caldilineaceae bacterium]
MPEQQVNHCQTDVHILVVDDEEKLGRYVCMLLEQMGYRATACVRIEEARHLLTLRTWHLVITDIVLPGENGFDLMRWVKQHYRELPIIAMTAHPTEAVNYQLGKFGFAAILQKPFSIAHLQQILQQIGLPLLTAQRL